MENRWKILTLAILLLLAGSALFPLTQSQAAPPLFTLHWVANADYKIDLDLAEFLKAELANFGIEIEIHSYDSATRFSRTISQAGPKMLTYEEGGYDICYANYIWMPSDYIWYLGCFNTEGIPPHGWNYWAWKDGAADTYLRNAMGTYNFTERVKWMWKWQDECHEEAPVVFLGHPTRLYLSRIDLRGWIPQLLAYDVDKWTLLGKTPEEDITLHFRLVFDPGMWLPFFLDGGYETLNMLYRALYRQTYSKATGFTTEPDMAKSLEISEDGMTVTVTLRDDIKWHDGTPFTSKDVKYTYDTILNPKAGSTFHGDFSAAVKSVDAPDDYTVILHLKKPSPEIKTLIACPGTMIVPEHVLSGIAPEDLRTCSWNTERPPPGTGPMKFIEWKRGEYIKFDAFDEYYAGPIFVDHIIEDIIPDSTVALSALEAGEIDVPGCYFTDYIQADVERLKAEASDKLNTTEFTAINSMFLPLNNEHPILANKYVRKAISYMIPYERIHSELMYGLAIPASSWCHPDTWGFNPNTPHYTYDPEKAREYLRLAGYPEWPPPAQEIPLSTYLLPAVGGLVAGVVIGFVANWIIMRRRKI